MYKISILFLILAVYAFQSFHCDDTIDPDAVKSTDKDPWEKWSKLPSSGSKSQGNDYFVLSICNKCSSVGLQSLVIVHRIWNVSTGIGIYCFGGSNHCNKIKKFLNVSIPLLFEIWRDR